MVSSYFAAIVLTTSMFVDWLSLESLESFDSFESFVR